MDEDRLFALVTTLSSRITLLEVAVASMARHLKLADALAADLTALRAQAEQAGMALDEVRLINMLRPRSNAADR